jgi:hypothetical protein
MDGWIIHCDDFLPVWSPLVPPPWIMNKHNNGSDVIPNTSTEGKRRALQISIMYSLRRKHGKKSPSATALSARILRSYVLMYELSARNLVQSLANLETLSLANGD